MFFFSIDIVFPVFRDDNNNYYYMLNVTSFMYSIYAYINKLGDV